MTCVLLYGLCGTGKSAFCERAYDKFGLHYIQLRRLFESIVGKEDAPNIYHQLYEKTNSRTSWLELIKDELLTKVRNKDTIIIEGLFTREEAMWFESFSSVYTIYLEVMDKGTRLLRYSSREKICAIDAQRRLSESDSGRIAAGVTQMKGLADYIITNDGSREEFLVHVDSIIKQIVSFPRLVELCHHVNRTKGLYFSPLEIVYYIRHLSIADGCKNACSHCFSDSVSTITQTTLSGFQRVISEIGQAIAFTGRPLSFFHLGASTDPASVRGYAMYLQMWRSSFPEFQMIKVFSHGWDLSEKNQLTELSKTLEVARKYGNIKFVISFDAFSRAARNNWQEYIKNVTANVRRIIDSVGKERIRIEVFYDPSRNKCNKLCTLEHWREEAKRGNRLTLNQIIDECNSVQDKDSSSTCAKVTSGLMSVFMLAGLSVSDLINMSRDCQSVFSAGRAKQYYRTESHDTIQKGLEIQREHVLYPLKDYKYGYEGLIIYPGGEARFVDYAGFHLLQKINGGKRVISCMSSSTYDIQASKEIRKIILKLSLDSQTAHIPSAFSMCDYLGVLFESIVSPFTHRFVLGKPFGAQAYYALFSFYGWIGKNLSKYGSLNPEWRYIIQTAHPQVTYIDESMGNCLSVASGIAMAGKRVFVNISDAAFQEGTIWESALFAGSHHLSNLIMAIDNNEMQALGKISDILSLGILKEKLESFGWRVFSCDGHDLGSLHRMIEEVLSTKKDSPIAMVMHTKKGRGVSFIEGDPSWHYKLLDEEHYHKALEELV